MSDPRGPSSRAAVVGARERKSGSAHFKAVKHLRRTLIAAAVFALLIGQPPSTAFSSDNSLAIGEYRAKSLVGGNALESALRYVSFAGDTGFRGWAPEAPVLEKLLTVEAKLLSTFDLNVVNLEFGLEGPFGEEIDRRRDALILDFMKRVGYGVVSIANNHVLDLGSAGVVYEAAELRRRGFVVLGLRSNPVYLWGGEDRPIAIWAATAYTDKPDPDKLVLTLSEEDLTLIKAATARATLRIAFVHLGSMSSFPSDHERREVRRVLDSGADLVVCTGSHFYKGFVREGGKPVIYGIGDHLFSYVATPGTESVGVHFVAGVGAAGIEQALAVPFWNDVRNGRLGPLDTEAFREFERTIRERSTTDARRYYDDPRSIATLKGQLARLRFRDILNLKPRQVVYAFRIFWARYPAAVATACIGLPVLAGLTAYRVRKMRRRRRGRQPGLTEPRGDQKRT